jgi:RNA polymerase sigma-70 factor (ECF subfamily)
MTEQDLELEQLRRRGFAIAYRMLGSVAEAEDIVQEALIRYTKVAGTIEEPAAWITTVTTRLSIDHLRLARVRRESYVGPWIPEPLLEDPEPGPAAQLELADSLSQAFLVVLERLTPVERAAFLLRDVFDYDYARIAEMLGRNEASCRQLVSRANRHLQANRPRFDADPEQRNALLERFLAAAEEGDVGALEQMLAEDAVLYGDGGGKVVATPVPIFGATEIAAFVAMITRSRQEIGEFDVELVSVNGQPGRVMRVPETHAVWDVLSVDVVDGRIQTIRIVRNPDKLGHV